MSGTKVSQLPLKKIDIYTPSYEGGGGPDYYISMTILSDGSFTGEYFGSSRTSCSGKFSSLKKVNEYCYTMVLSDYSGEDHGAFKVGSTFTLYMKDTPSSQVSSKCMEDAGYKQGYLPNKLPGEMLWCENTGLACMNGVQ